MILPDGFRPAEPADDELWPVIQAFVTPDRRYLWLLNGNFMRLPPPARAAFVAALRADAARVTDDELALLLSSDWRPRLTAAWLIAASRREQFVGRLGDLLVESTLTYAGQGYAVALAAIGGPDAVARLEGYLDVWLPRVDRRYDQDWVMGALAYRDEVDGTSRADRFEANGLWDAWAGGVADRLDLTAQLRDVVAMVTDGALPTRYPCPCCGRLVHDEPAGFQICPVCLWEDDQVQLRWPLYPAGANKVSLVEAQRTYAGLGVSEERRLGPRLDTPSRWPLDHGFRPVDLTVDDFEATGVQEAAWPDDRTVLYYWRPTFWRSGGRAPGTDGQATT